jgi:hypothetical protein
MLTHVPLATYFQELPWKSTVEVPAQVVPAPAAQSLPPFRATPKHFSLSAAIALVADTRVAVETAAATADASMAALNVRRVVFMINFLLSKTAAFARREFEMPQQTAH